MQSNNDIMINLNKRQNNLKKEYLKLEKQLLLFQSDTLKEVKKNRCGKIVDTFLYPGTVIRLRSSLLKYKELYLSPDIILKLQF